MIKKISLILVLFTRLTFNSNVGIGDEKSLEQLQNAFSASEKYMTQKVKNEHAMICLGATRAGKSTLINYLIGTNLKAEKVSRVRPVTITKVDNASSGPEIGVGSTSKTTIPTKWISGKLSELAIWDAPGFDDNRGAIQDITNAFYIYQLLQKVESLKVLLVIDFNDLLSDNIKPFTSVLEAVENLLGSEIKNHFRSISVIFTKVPKTLNEVSVDIKVIIDLLTEKVLSSENISISQNSRDFVQFLVANSQHIGLFKRAEVGPITSAVDVNIFGAIKISKSIEKDVLKEIMPSISDSSKLFLFNARHKLFSKEAFKELEENVNIAVERNINNFYAFNEARNYYGVWENELDRIITTLTNNEKQLYSAMFHTSSFKEKLEILQTIDSAIRITIEKQDLFNKFKLMEFVDKLLDLKDSNQLEASLQGILSSSISKLKECLASVYLKKYQLAQRKKDIELQEEQMRLQRERDALIRRINEAKRRNGSSKITTSYPSLILVLFAAKLLF